jgi:hypothetical protein
MSESFTSAVFCLIFALVMVPVIPLFLSAFPEAGLWAALSKQYATSSECDGHWLHAQSLLCRVGCYLNCVSLCITEEYLYIRLSPVMFWLSSSIRIPWTDIESVSDKTGFWSNNRSFSLMNGQEITFIVTPQFDRYFSSHAKQIGQTRLLFSKGEFTG